MPYTIFIYDNFHYQDESEAYRLADYESFDKALEISKKNIDDFLIANLKPGMTESELWDVYQGFGEAPLIVAWGGDIKKDFSSWDYAKTRCSELCEND